MMMMKATQLLSFFSSDKKCWTSFVRFVCLSVVKLRSSFLITLPDEWRWVTCLRSANLIPSPPPSSTLASDTEFICDESKHLNGFALCPSASLLGYFFPSSPDQPAQRLLAKTSSAPWLRVHPNKTKLHFATTRTSSSFISLLQDSLCNHCSSPHSSDMDERTTTGELILFIAPASPLSVDGG